MQRLDCLGKCDVECLSFEDVSHYLKNQSQSNQGG